MNSPSSSNLSSQSSHRPRKRFGQNFLQDFSVISAIVGAIDPQPNDRLVEIGPGQGALTCELLPLVKQMQAVELDRDLIPILEQKCADAGESGKLTIHSADVLKFDFSTLLPEISKENPRKLRIVGNLPYNISTPLIFKLLPQLPIIQDMHFMLQKEVVNRLAAMPGSGTYGRLSVMVQRFCRVESILDVPPHAFYPPPKVDSAVVRLVPWETSTVEIADEAHFAQVVTAAFAQRRKTLRNSLKKLVSLEQFEQSGIDPIRRAETLSLQEFAALSALSSPD